MPVAWARGLHRMANTMFARSVLLVGFLAVACSSEQRGLLPEQGTGGAPDLIASGGTAGESAGSGGVIDPNAGCVCGRNDQNAATLSLECWCADNWCPTQSEVSAPVDACTGAASIRGPFVRRGCGVVEYASSSFYGGSRRQFDEVSGALVAMQIGADTSGGPCNANIYEIGPFQDCPDFVECVNCLSSDGETTAAPLCSELE